MPGTAHGVPSGPKQGRGAPRLGTRRVRPFSGPHPRPLPRRSAEARHGPEPGHRRDHLLEHIVYGQSRGPPAATEPAAGTTIPRPSSPSPTTSPARPPRNCSRSSTNSPTSSKVTTPTSSTATTIAPMPARPTSGQRPTRRCESPATPAIAARVRSCSPNTRAFTQPPILRRSMTLTHLDTRFVGTGESRMDCIGGWTSRSGKTRVGFVEAMRPIIWV